MGDSVFGLSSVQYIKSQFPEAKVTYAIPKWIVPLYQNLKSAVDNFYELDLKGVSGQLHFYYFLMKKKFDLVIELHESARSTRILKFASLVGSFPYESHNHHLDRFSGTGVFDQGIRKSIIQRDLDGVYSALLKYGRKDLDYGEYLDYGPSLSLELEKQNQVTLGIVATRVEKKWPISSYVELTKKLFEYNPDLKVVIPVSKGTDDQNQKKEFLNLLNDKRVEFIEKGLAEVPKTLSQSKLYIGNDTGLKHISAALGVKTVTIFGPEEPLEWHPYDYYAHPFFWVYGSDVRSTPAPCSLLQQFDRSIDISDIKPEEVSTVCIDLLEKMS
ncbi:MAG: glycosyltransferase family 9 protein [Bacteriovoracaceae bacterium]